MTLHKTLIVAALLLLSQFSYSQDFQEGRDYSTLEGQGAAESPGVVEYFSFSCPGCFAMEPYIKALDEKLALSAFSSKVRRVHTPFGGQKATLSQKAFALLSVLDAEQHHYAIFKRVQVERNVFNDESELIDYFQTLGYQRTLIEGALTSFTLDSLLRKMDSESKKLKIMTVPSLVVNGRFQINIKMIKSHQDLQTLVQYLLDLSEPK